MLTASKLRVSKMLKGQESLNRIKSFLNEPIGSNTHKDIIFIRNFSELRQSDLDQVTKDLNIALHLISKGFRHDSILATLLLERYGVQKLGE